MTQRTAIEPLVIGGVKLDNRVILAPMAGVCNLPFRTLAKRLGAGMVCAEMVSDKALVFHNERTWHMVQTRPEEHPVSLQLVGADLDSMVRAAELVNEATSVDIIDINMGCPVSKVHKTGSGAALAKDPSVAAAIVDAVVRHVNRPVTVKFRKGWDDGHVNAVEVARAVEAAGAQAVTVHGRTAKQLYAGKADWSIIRAVKSAVSIPVIGNGDVVGPEEAMAMLDQTGCDGVMVGRAALGYPWIFREIAHYIETGMTLPPPSYRERLQVAIEHLHLLVDDKGEYTGVREMRKHAGWYVKGLPKAAELRDRLHLPETLVDMQDILMTFMETCALSEV